MSASLIVERRDRDRDPLRRAPGATPVAMKENNGGDDYIPSSNIRSAADIDRAAAGAIDIDAKTTTYVILACMVAASGGILFGYDGGVTGASKKSNAQAKPRKQQLGDCSCTDNTTLLRPFHKLHMMPQGVWRS